MSESQVCQCQDHKPVYSVVAMMGICQKGVLRGFVCEEKVH